MNKCKDCIYFWCHKETELCCRLQQAVPRRSILNACEEFKPLALEVPEGMRGKPVDNLT